MRSALTRCSLEERLVSSTVAQISIRLSYRTPWNFGFSPGAEFSLIIFKALTCVKARTVAATNQGKPSNDWINIVMERMNKSRWYPSFFLNIEQKDSIGIVSIVLYLPLVWTLFGWWSPRLSVDPWRLEWSQWSREQWPVEWSREDFYQRTESAIHDHEVVSEWTASVLSVSEYSSANRNPNQTW